MSLLKELTAHFNVPYNPDLGRHEQIARPYIVVSGSPFSTFRSSTHWAGILEAKYDTLKANDRSSQLHDLTYLGVEQEVVASEEEEVSTKPASKKKSVTSKKGQKVKETEESEYDGDEDVESEEEEVTVTKERTPVRSTKKQEVKHEKLPKQTVKDRKHASPAPARQGGSKSAQAQRRSALTSVCCTLSSLT